MAEITNKKTRMYEPWGYQEENNYESSENQFEIELNELFASAKYDDTDKKIHFFNNDGEELSGSSIDTTQFASSVVEEAYYDKDTKELVIKFSNGDEVRINMAEIIDENEFADGLQVDSDGIVSVKIDESGDSYLTVGSDGIKLSGVKSDIDAETARATSAETTLQEAIDNEISRATSAETTLDEKINQEIQDRKDDVDAEETRAKAKEDEIKAALDAEIARSIREDELHDDELSALNTRVGLLDTKLDSEITRSTSADTVLDNKITAEETRAKEEENAINDRIDDIISGATPITKLEELIEKLGYKDNETLTLTNEHEVAFGEYNISHTSEDASGQTIFSIGNGTSESEKSNAIEIMKNGDVYLWVEGDFMNINKLLGQLAHEVYDTDSAHNSHFFDGGN